MMGEEFYSVIKLVSGEEVFSLVCVDENDGDPLIILQNPVVMKVINSEKGYFVKVKPWMEIANDDMYIIKLDKIITMTEISDKNMIFFYEKYVNDEDKEEEIIREKDGKVKISNKMGFISTVEDARKRLENLYKNNKEI